VECSEASVLVLVLDAVSLLWEPLEEIAVRTPEQKKEANQRYYWKHHQKSLERRAKWRDKNQVKVKEHKRVVKEAIERAKAKEEAVSKQQRNIESTKFWWGTPVESRARSAGHEL